MPKITGFDTVLAKLDGLAGQKMVDTVGQALVVGGELIQKEAQRLITENAVSGKFHVASAPGEPPKNDTSHLHDFIITEHPETLRVNVTSNAKYSAALEFGTSKMAARPFLGPATRTMKPKVAEVVAAAVSHFVKGT